MGWIGKITLMRSVRAGAHLVAVEMSHGRVGETRATGCDFDRKQAFVVRR